MSLPIRVFLDSDVIVSSLMSSTGAARLLMESDDAIRFYSNFSMDECARVCARLRLNQGHLNTLLKKQCRQVVLKQSITEIQKRFGVYTTDSDDAHVVAGAATCKAAFILSYNLKHFKMDKIRQDFRILVLTPALLLQYIRSHGV